MERLAVVEADGTLVTATPPTDWFWEQTKDAQWRLGTRDQLADMN